MDITAEELKRRIDAGEALLILDVREDWEFEEGHINGARNFSLYSIPTQSADLEDWKEKEVIVHCKSGARSKKAQYLLQELGFTNTLSLLGGYEAFIVL